MDSLTPRPPISAMDHHLHSFASCGGSYAVVHGSTQTPLRTLKTLPKKGATAIFASSLKEKNAPLLHSLESVWKHLSPQFTLRGSNWYCGFPHLFTGFVAQAFPPPSLKALQMATLQLLWPTERCTSKCFHEEEAPQYRKEARPS